MPGTVGQRNQIREAEVQVAMSVNQRSSRRSQNLLAARLSLTKRLRKHSSLAKDFRISLEAGLLGKAPPVVEAGELVGDRTASLQ